MKHLVTDMT